MMRYRYVWLVLIACLSASGCATKIQVDTNYDPQHEFSNYRNYAWYDRVDAPSQVVENRIRNAIEAALTAQGYSRVESGDQADFLLSFSAVAEQAIRPDSISSGMGYRRSGWGHSTFTAGGFREYTKGTLIIDIIEPATKNLVWRAVSSAVLYPGSSEEDKNRLVSETVAAMLDKFPPGSR
jgi:hypothetical protein